MAQRKRYDGAFKARVAVEAIKGEKTLNEIAGLYGVHPTLIGKWKKDALEGLADLLSDRQARKQERANGKDAELYQRIGQLSMEVAYLKKKLGLFQ